VPGRWRWQVDETDSLDALVRRNDPPVVLFLCGPLLSDLEETDARGRRLSDRFAGLPSWTTLSHEQLNQLPSTVCDLVERRRAPATATAAAAPLKNTDVTNLHVYIA